ncbi:MAG TPA: hypothetical protein PLO63_12420 [Syntrophales bacterium]|jgi:hypothetical protein|nr:hypothetical protein [Syntrophales bacterium]
MEMDRSRANRTRYRPGQRKGHYESFFQRANHPTRPLAFWIRYTIFSPQDRPGDAIGELWAVWFDGETGSHTAVKKEVPFRECAFSEEVLSARVADAVLDEAGLKGDAASGGHRISWDLRFSGRMDPLFLLPLNSYEAGFPKAKSLVGMPMAVYSGVLAVDGREVAVTDWVGSQNHNWGSKHTDQYAWGQVAGFDTHPDSFLEIATARVRIGPFWTPYLTPLVLRHRGEEIALNGFLQMFRARGRFDYFTWTFRSETDAVRLEGTLSAPREAFIGLNYYNPPGGGKHCLNTKIAACEIRVTRKGAAATETLATLNRAAFEILTDDTGHGIEISA